MKNRGAKIDGKLSSKQESSFAPYLLWMLASAVTLIFILSLVFPYLKRDSRDYKDPDYLRYKKQVESCNSFYGGAKVPDEEPVVYDAWKSNMPIGC